MEQKRNFKRLLNLQEAADLLGISLWTVRRWASERRFSIAKLGGRVLVPEESLRAFIEENTVEAREHNNA